jgi:hypothetical protein
MSANLPYLLRLIYTFWAAHHGEGDPTMELSCRAIRG